jgi:KaiC/GvpD/RAD55 family RecA-like ATPase
MSSWTEFVGDAQSGHAVQVYADLDELAGSVAAYLSAGFENGEPAVVVATREHIARFAEQLAAAGWDETKVQADRLLVLADADATLADLMDGELPSPARFETVIGGLLDHVAERFPDARVRVFGEMVDLLAERGQTEAAVRLEQLWNELARRRSFSLLCGYRLDVFDRASQQMLPAVCSAHTHVRPAYNMARLDRAVHGALEEVLGTGNARMVREIVSEDLRHNSAPVSEQMLMWVSDRMPRHAERVLAAARARYEAAPVAVS